VVEASVLLTRAELLLVISSLTRPIWSRYRGGACSRKTYLRAYYRWSTAPFVHAKFRLWPTGGIDRRRANPDLL